MDREGIAVCYRESLDVTALVWLVSFSGYLLSGSPSLGGEDSGEFTAAAATLGVGHAPGYPLYALAGRLMCALPVGSAAFRLNLLSAAAAATAVAVLYGLVVDLARARFGLAGLRAAACAMASAGCLGWSQALWYQAAISDKYAVHLALFAVGARLAAGGAAGPAVSFWLGLGLSHHLQMLYLLPGLALNAARSRKKTARTAAMCAALLLLGLSPKLVYPPVRAAQDPPLLLAAPRTAAAHLAYLRASTYARRVPGPGWIRWLATGRTLAAQAGVTGIVAGVAGLAVLLARATATGLLLGLTGLTGLALAASLEITGREFYLLPVVWVLAAGVGGLLAAVLEPRASGWRRVGAVAFLLPAVLFRANLPWRQRAAISLEYDYGRNLLAGCPPRTVCFISGDDVIYPVLHLQLVEGFRPDVIVIPEGFLTYGPARDRIARALPELGATLAQPVGSRDEAGWSRQVAGLALDAGRPVALTNPSREAIAAGLHRSIRDLVYEVWDRAPRFRSPPRPASWMRTRGWHADPGALTEREQWLIGLYGKYQRQYADELANGGHPLAALSRFRNVLATPGVADREGAANNYALALAKTGDIARALAVFDRLTSGGTLRPEIWINAGNASAGAGRSGEANDRFRRALALAPPGSAYARYAASRLGGEAHP